MSRNSESEQQRLAVNENSTLSDDQRGGGGERSAAQGGNPPIIDLKIAMENVAGDEELFEAVKDSALEEIPRLYFSLVSAIDSGQQADAQRHAHTIKGAARVIAATKTMLVSERIEHASAKGELDRARDSLEELKQVINELVETLSEG
jgi:HPt (histidine-containing phosphotransfer) domain-containing protein